VNIAQQKPLTYVKQGTLTIKIQSKKASIALMIRHPKYDNTLVNKGGVLFKFEFEFRNIFFSKVYLSKKKLGGAVNLN